MQMLRTSSCETKIEKMNSPELRATRSQATKDQDFVYMALFSSLRGIGEMRVTLYQ